MTVSLAAVMCSVSGVIPRLQTIVWDFASRGQVKLEAISGVEKVSNIAKCRESVGRINGSACYTWFSLVESLANAC